MMLFDSATNDTLTLNDVFKKVFLWKKIFLVTHCCVVFSLSCSSGEKNKRAIQILKFLLPTRYHLKKYFTLVGIWFHTSKPNEIIFFILDGER